MNLLKGNKLKMKVFLVLISLLTIGCGGNTLQQSNDVTYINKPVNYQKPGAAISLTNTEVVLANTNIEYGINMDLTSGYSSGELALTLSTSEGLSLGGEKVQNLQLTKGNMKLPLTVRANEPGRYYIYLTARVKQDNRLTTGRALAFIVNIGDFDSTKVSLKSQPQVKGGVVELKAKEKIIQ